MSRRAFAPFAIALLLFAPPAFAQPFSYNPAGQLVAGSGQGTADDTVYAPGMRFPIETAPAYANSQVWGNGGMNGPGGSQCDSVNYSYPWWDNFCETRSWTTPMCPTGEGHQGQDIRPSTCDKDVHWAVAAEDGTITNIGTYSVALTTPAGTRHNYLHLEPSSLVVSVGDSVQRGERIGRVSNAFGGTPTTIHLHYEIRLNVSGIGDTPVPPYMSLVASYEELLGVPAKPCAVIPPEGGVLDDSGPCARFFGPPDSWRDVAGAGNDGNLHWTYAFDDPDPSNWAQWLAHFEQGGEYEVEIHILSDYAQSRQTRCRVRHAGQDSDQVLDMTAADGWRSLGTFPFDTGGDQFVALYDNTGEALSDQRMIMFDAVRFTRKLEPEPLPEAGADVTVPDVAAPLPDVAAPDAGQDGPSSSPSAAWAHDDEAEGCACSTPGAMGEGRGALLLLALGLALPFARRRRTHRRALRRFGPLALSPLLLLGCGDDESSEEKTVPSRSAMVSVSNRPPVAQVSERFLSVAVDTAQVVGAPFWSADGSVSVIGDERRPPYDFSRPKLRKLAAELAPAYLRIGGSTADKTYFDMGDTPTASPPEGYDEVMTREQWDGIGAFAADLDYEILFTLNVGPGPRDAEGNWDPANARELVTYTTERGYPVVLWELGNEINGFALLHGPSSALSAEQYASDMATARALVDELDPDAWLAGPSSAYWPLSGEQIPLMDEFLRLGGDLLDVVTWHYYPQQSVRCPIAVRRAEPEVLMQPENLDEVLVWASEVQSSAADHALGLPVWLGESGNAQCGGEPGVSDTFVGGFWWLDQLGLMARERQPVVVRQTLSGSNYGMIDDETLEPNPDYWNSLLWRRLMGTVVLLVDGPTDDAMLRTYAHCTRPGAPGYAPGGVTLLLLNLDLERAVDVSLEGLGESFEVYLMTSDSLQGERVKLNGVWLEAAQDGSVPPLPGEPSGAELRLAPRSYAFVVAPEAQKTACQ